MTTPATPPPAPASAAEVVERLKALIARCAYQLGYHGQVTQSPCTLVTSDDLCAAIALIERGEQERARLEELAGAQDRADSLAADLKKKVEDYLGERYCCSGQECGCFGVTRLQQYVQEEAGTQIADLRARLAAAQERVGLLENVLREDIISARIIASEVQQAGVNRHGITRDIGFIINRCNEALAARAAKGQP
jgi:hypothetical protein